MLAIVLSLLFGFVAVAALVAIHGAAVKGVRHGRLIRAELAETLPLRVALSRGAVRNLRPA